MTISSNSFPPKAHGFQPDYFAKSIFEVDFMTLQARGVKNLVLDVDHTVAEYNALSLDAKTQDFLTGIVRTGKIEKIYLASNSKRDLSGMASSIGATVIRPIIARKPSPYFYRRIQAVIGGRPEDSVMVGDKIVTDIWGGNRAGFMTVLVEPIGPEIPIDRLLMRRFWGRMYLRSKNRPES